MKVIIAGSRSISRISLIDAAVLESGITDITEVVSGAARGADRLGEEWAKACHIPIKQFIPDWNGEYKRRAGIMRNCQMAHYADCLIAVWDGYSTGTKHMIRYMQSLDKPVYVKELKPGER